MGRQIISKHFRRLSKNLYNVWAALFARPGWFAKSIDIILMGISTSKLTSVLESYSDK